MLINIDDIKVSDRIRKDCGNIDELAEDIKKNGLINPIAVTSDYLGIGRDLLTNLAKSKEIKSKDFGTERKSRYRFRKEWLDEYMEE